MKHLITGVAGQDGSYLAELLLARGDRVVGLVRRSSSPNLWRLEGVLDHPRLRLVTGDVADAGFMHRLVAEELPDFLFNLAAQSHVGTSFAEPSHTTSATYLGALNCLEAIRALPAYHRPRFYQASSSEMFGSAFTVGNLGGWEHFTSQDHASQDERRRAYQDESTPFLPNSPYATAKLAAHHLCRVYRESYGVFASSGILFNHESSRRGPEFVTRKIASYCRMLADGKVDVKLRLGNLKACRDWGHAADYVKAMVLMLEHDQPDDFVVATGESHSVEDFLSHAFGRIGRDWREHVEIDASFFRPCEVPYLRGSAEKAKRQLGWSPSISFPNLVREMVDVG